MSSTFIECVATLNVCIHLVLHVLNVAYCRSSEVSQNFVRLNMKIRRYKRKGQSSTSKFKRHRFGKKDTCYKCGGKGHWARDCPASTNLGTFDGEEVLYCEDQEEEELGEEEDTTVQEETACNIGEGVSTGEAEEECVEGRGESVVAGDTASVCVAVPEAKTRGKKSVKKATLDGVSTERKRKRAVGTRKGKGKADQASEGSSCEQTVTTGGTWDLPADSMGSGGSQLQHRDSTLMVEGESQSLLAILLIV